MQINKRIAQDLFRLILLDNKNNSQKMFVFETKNL